jgi:N-acetylmuramoyl-L-alanine amidase
MRYLKRIWLGLILAFSLLSFASFADQDQRVEVYDLRPWTHPTYTRIAVDIGKLREYTYGELKAPDRIFVDILQAKLNPILHNKTFLVKNDYISQIRIAQKTPSTVRVVVDLDFKKVPHYRVWHLFDPFRVVIDIYPHESPPKPSPSTSVKPPQPTKSGYTMIRQLGLGVQRIVIDPGHGGRHPGCIGKGGLQEKHVVLDVSQRLKKLLESKTDLDVILTRESDIYLPLENRPVIANQQQGDLFISVHANANRSKRVSGVQSFYLNFSTDPSVLETAAKENATSTKNISEMMDIIRKIARNTKIEESKEFALKIHKSLVKCLSQKYSKVKDMGVRGAPLWVLIGGKMPSVLIEVSYLSNPTEESRLKTPQYRQLVAQGIYEGILEYIRSLGKGN